MFNAIEAERKKFPPCGCLTTGRKNEVEQCDLHYHAQDTLTMLTRLTEKTARAAVVSMSAADWRELAYLTQDAKAAIAAAKGA